MPASCKSAWVSSVVLQESIHRQAEQKVSKSQKTKIIIIYENIIKSYQNNWQDLVNPSKKKHHFSLDFTLFILPCRQSKLLGLSRVNDNCPEMGCLHLVSNKISPTNVAFLKTLNHTCFLLNANWIIQCSFVTYPFSSQNYTKEGSHWKLQTRGSYPHLLANGGVEPFALNQVYKCMYCILIVIDKHVLYIYRQLDCRLYTHYIVSLIQSDKLIHCLHESHSNSMNNQLYNWPTRTSREVLPDHQTHDLSQSYSDQKVSDCLPWKYKWQHGKHP